VSNAVEHQYREAEMKKTKRLVACLAVAAVAACGNATGPEITALPDEREYVEVAGSGGEATVQSDTTGRYGGLLGSGH
jgi:hypothetical protein